MSAQTMRRLVKLARAKHGHSHTNGDNDVSSPHSKKKKKNHIQRGKTMTNVRVQTDNATSTEQKVAHRLSITMNQQKKTTESLHIRSFSLPKTSHLMDGDEDPQSPSSDIEQNDSPRPTITVTQAQNNVDQIGDLPPSTMNNMVNSGASSNSSINAAQLGVDNQYAHIPTASETQTINSEFSETVYTENTEYTKDDDESTQYGYSTLRPSSKQQQQQTQKRQYQGSLMSVGSASSMTVSTFDSSMINVKGPNVMPPALETVNEPSDQHINNMQYADEQILGTQHNQHAVQQSVVGHMTAPKINMNGDDEYDQQRSRGSLDYIQSNIQNEQENNSSSSIWSCLMCGCCQQSQADDTDYDENGNAKDEEYDAEDVLQLDMDDWRTFKSAGSRIRRPTQYTTVTNNEDSTINVDDVRMWNEPFGKGASGRVFKGLYLPLCQIIALKVTSRLDNDNVKQILGEWKQQQEFLPDCDELMRIHGWYRNLATNEIAVALEYMDMGSVYDSCFNNANNHKPSVSIEEFNKTGHEQICVNKLTYDQLRFIARQTLLGLYALHSNSPPLIHRDIKPQNILLSSFGSVKIADFGLLVELTNGVCTDSKGTSKYFSPERIQGSFDCHADIWSLGITLIEIYKQELISAEDLDWFKIVEDGIDIDDFLPATTPTELLDFLRQCLQHRSEDRPSAKQLLSHKFISRKWGNPLDDNNLRNISVQFSKEDGNQKLLDKILSWLEEWIMADEENNGKLFLEGDSEYLKQCVYNLSKYSGLPPKYIDRYIADLYRETILL